MALFDKFKNIFSRENKSQEDKEIDKQKLDDSLNKTKSNFFDKISKKIAGKSKIDDNDLDTKVKNGVFQLSVGYTF